MVDTWPVDQEFLDSSPDCCGLTLSPWQGSLHEFPPPTHVNLVLDCRQ